MPIVVYQILKFKQTFFSTKHRNCVTQVIYASNPLGGGILNTTHTLMKVHRLLSILTNFSQGSHSGSKLMITNVLHGKMYVLKQEYTMYLYTKCTLTQINLTTCISLTFSTQQVAYRFPHFSYRMCHGAVQQGAICLARVYMFCFHGPIKSLQVYAHVICVKFHFIPYYVLKLYICNVSVQYLQILI